MDDRGKAIQTLSDNSRPSPTSGSGVSAPACATAAIRFRIAGPVAMLSHAETSRVLQRACVRADVPVRYSEGFNPHPRLSLPLPRPVGVESEDELLVVRLHENSAARWAGDRAAAETAMMRALAGELPEGMDVLSVALEASNASFRPRSAEYVLPLRIDGEPGLAGAVGERIAGVMASEHCLMERPSGERKAARRIDVRAFLVSVRLEGGNLIVQHLTGAAGSIRVDEILQLFGVRIEDLAGPVRRVNVAWETTRLNSTTQQSRPIGGAEEIEDVTRDVN